MSFWNGIRSKFLVRISRPKDAGTKRASKSLCRATSFEVLENRLLLAVNVSSGINGLAFPESGFSVPPDTNLSVGPSHIVETVNSTIAFFDKTTGNRISQDFIDHFLNADYGGCGRSSIFDPRTSYDELAGRFVLVMLLKNPCAKNSHLLVAVSNSSDPTGSWEKHDLDVTEAVSGGGLGTTWADFPGLGWDADAIYVTMNMYNFGGSFDHVQIVTIDAASATDGDAATVVHFDVDRASPHITLQPAVMHGALPGDPMFLVEEAGFSNGTTLRVTSMTNKLSDTPSFSDTDISVTAYRSPPRATQLGSRKKTLNTNDTSILNAEWRGGRLVAAQNVGLAGRNESHVRWYEFNTATMTLTQQGTIDPGSGVHTYYPSIAIAPSGDLGLTYMQSSAREFMSVYVTAQQFGGTAGVMQTPALAKAGEATYTGFRHPPYRAGDYSGIVIDPVNGTFWAANEYATSAGRDNWGTWIANFSLTP